MTDKRKRKYSQIDADGVTLKERVFLALTKYPNSKPMDICKFLKLNYYVHGPTVRSYKYEFKKRQRQIGRGLKSLTTKNVRFFGYALKSIDRKNVTVFARYTKGGKRWFLSRGRNRALIYKCGIGRIEWFETGRINCWVKKPATLGKMKQLLTEGFFKTGLVFDINVFNDWTESFRLLGMDLVLDTGERLPYAKISLLKEQTGVVVVMGDKSHPTGLEMHIILPRWRQKQEMLNEVTVNALDNVGKLITEFNGIIGGLGKPKPLDDNNKFTV